MKFTSIKTKFLSSFAIFFSLLYLILILFIAFVGSSHYLYYLNKNARYFINLTFREIQDAFNVYFPENQLRFNERMSEILALGPDLEKIVILDSLGSVIFSTTELSGLTADEEEISQIAPHNTKSFEIVERENRDYYFLVPILNDLGYHSISIAYYFSEAPVIRFRRTLVISSILAFIILISGTLLMQNFITKDVIQNIYELKRVAESFEKGDYSVRANVQSNDELLFLSNAINSMLETITNHIYNLRAMVSELESRDKARENVLAKISHELRTPLTTCKGYVDLLKSGKMGKISDEQRKALEIVDRNLIRLEDETKLLLQSSKLAIEKIDLKKEHLDLEKLVAEVVENFNAELRRKRQHIEIKLEQRTLFGDKELVISIIENLVSNAIKYGSEGGKVAISTLDSEFNGRKYTQIDVYNSGAKISEDEFRKIFDPFYQIKDGSKRESLGMGLGLYIVKRAVELHNGVIKVQNVEDGIIFSVFIPSQGEKQ